MTDRDKKLLFSALVIIIWTSNLFAECPGTLWTKTYGGINSDRASSVQQTSDAGYIVAGHSESYNPSGACLIKTDANGNTLWIKIYEGTYARSVQQTSDGGYIWAGNTSGSLLIVKTDSLGDTLWSRIYKGGNYTDTGEEVQQTTDGRYIVVGMTSRFNGVEYEYAIFLLRVDNNGDTLWTKKFGWYFSAWGYSVRQTFDGGYIVLGYKMGDICLIKTDSAGNALWQKIHDLGGVDYGYSVKQTSDGGYIIAGRTGPPYDICIIKTNLIGDTLWTRTYGGANHDGGSSIQETFDSCYVVAGETESFGAGGRDVYLIKIDTLGNLLWSNTFGGAEFDAGREVQQTIDKGYIIAGTTCSFGAGAEDIYLIRLGPDTLGIVDNQITKIDYSFLKVFPNLIYERCNIKYSLLKKTTVNILVFDVTGQVVKKTINKNQDVGIYKETFNMANLPQGIYFIRLDTDSYSEIKKIIIIK